MTRIRSFLAFLYDFIVGDDPTIAIVVVIALGITAALANSGVEAWWVMPCAVLAILTLSLLRAARVP
jgi:hydrogenase/urease accessory protein HupE